MIYDCIIIGAGASGLFCSAAFSTPVKGLILEKTRRPGTKLLMSGAGQCNITHSGSIKDFPARYGTNGKKVRGCLYQYSNESLIRFLNKNGVSTMTREDGKVFPASLNAREIRDLLLHLGRRNGFTIRYNTPVTALAQKTAPAEGPEPEKSLWKVQVENGQTFLGRCLVVAAGGCSYPSTGSDGSMFPVLQRDLPLSIVPQRPALAPVSVADYPYGNLSGISFPAASVQIFRGPENLPKQAVTTKGLPDGFRKIREHTGPLLLTHENFSGPLILNLSKDIRKNDRIVINYLYPLDKKEVQNLIQKASAHSSIHMQNLLSRQFSLPKSFVNELLRTCGTSPKAVAKKLTENIFTVTGTAGYDKAMVTCGGVALSEITPKTLECKNLPRLYIIGEALDIDGETGGYNLQFAYSSACAAAASVIAELRGGHYAKYH